MKLTVSSLLYIKYPRKEAFASMQRLGVRYVDLWDHPGFGSHVSVTDDDTDAVMADLAAHELQPATISLFSDDSEKMRAGIRYAAKIGCPLVVAGFSGGNTEQFAAFLRPLARDAAEHGVKLGVENHVDTPADSLDRLQALAELVPEITVCFAPPHAVCMGEDLRQDVTALGRRLSMFYLWDSPWASTGLTWFRNHWNHCSEEQFPGRGQLTPQYPALMETLRAIRFDGCANLLVHGSREWPVAKIEASLQASLQFLGLSPR